MTSYRDEKSLKRILSSYEDERITHNLKLLLNLSIQHGKSLNIDIINLVQTKKSPVVLEINGFEIIRIFKHEIQVLLIKQDVHLNSLIELNVSEDLNEFTPTGTAYYNFPTDKLTILGNELVAVLKSSMLYLLKFEPRDVEIKSIYQDLSFLDISLDTLTKHSRPKSKEYEVKISAQDIKVLTKLEIKELLAKNESEIHEFKTNIFWVDKFATNINKNILIKEVSGFLNSSGGYLIYGVTDNQEIVGINKELEKYDNSEDKYELEIRNLLEFGIGKSLSTRIKIDFIEIESKTLVVLIVPPSSKPVFSNQYFEKCKKHQQPPGPCINCVNQRVNVANYSTTQCFFVRNGNRVNMLNYEEAFEYIAMNWPNF